MSEPRVLDGEIIDSWYTASDEREPEWLTEIEGLLNQIAEDPAMHAQVRAIRRDLAWLRHEAWKREYPWGKEQPRWNLKRWLAMRLERLSNTCIEKLRTESPQSE